MKSRRKMEKKITEAEEIRKRAEKKWNRHTFTWSNLKGGDSRGEQMRNKGK